MSDMMQLHYKEMAGDRDDGKPKTIIETQTEWNDTYRAYTKYLEEFDRLLSVHINGSDAEFEVSLKRLGLLRTKKEDVTEVKAEQKDKSNDHSVDFMYKVSTAVEERNKETEITRSSSSFFERPNSGVRLLSTASSPLLERSKYRVGLLPTASSSLVERKTYKVGLLSTAASEAKIKGFIVKDWKKEVHIVDSTDCLCTPRLQIVRRIRNRLFGKKNGTQKSNK